MMLPIRSARARLDIPLYYLPILFGTNDLLNTIVLCMELHFLKHGREMFPLSAEA